MYTSTLKLFQSAALGTDQIVLYIHKMEYHEPKVGLNILTGRIPRITVYQKKEKLQTVYTFV